MIPHARIEHQLATRTRLKVPEKRNDDSYFAGLTAFLAKQPGIGRIRSRSAAASIVIEHSGSFTEIAARAANAGFFELTAAVPQLANRGAHLGPAANEPMMTRRALRGSAYIFAGLGAYQAGIARNFGTTVENFWNAYGAATTLRNPVLTALLVAIGVHQFIRGRWLGAAPSLLFYAFSSYRTAQQQPGTAGAQLT